MRHRIIFFVTAFSLAFTNIYGANPVKSRTWEPVELNFTVSTASLNPYSETISENSIPYLSAEFECKSCSVKKLVIPGFWDGGNNWKIRFSAPEPGTWTYRTSSQDK